MTYFRVERFSDDEARFYPIGKFETRDQAKKFIEKQGFDFTRAYRIVKVENSEKDTEIITILRPC